MSADERLHESEPEQGERSKAGAPSSATSPSSSSPSPFAADAKAGHLRDAREPDERPGERTAEQAAEKLAERPAPEGAAGPRADVHIYTAPPERDPLEGIFKELPELPPRLHRFKALTHEALIDELTDRRVIVLTSFEMEAAWAAAFSVACDAQFHSRRRALVSPARGRARHSDDLDINTIADHHRVRDHIVLVEIGHNCTFLDSFAILELGQSASLRAQLEQHEAYLVLAVNDKLWSARQRHALGAHAVSHFSYLLNAFRTPDPEARLARRFEEAAKGLKEREAWSQMYGVLRERLAKGPDALEAYLAELENTRHGGFDLLLRVEPSDATVELVGDESLAQRTALFVAAFFPDLDEPEFDDLVKRLLGDQMRTWEVSRRQSGPDGVVHIVSEPREEPWTAVYERDVDDIAHACHLTSVRRDDGRTVVDFDSAHLRRDVREQFRARHRRFIRRQVQRLLQTGVLFTDLSEAALDGLLRLFIERAREDPKGSGEAWLTELSGALQARFEGEPPEGTVHEQLSWLLAKQVAESHLQWFIFGRLSLLIREMLDQEDLRPLVGRIFTSLISANQEEALLNVVLGLIERLRFAPHFDPFVWLRRLLDESGQSVRTRTQGNLLTLAQRSRSRAALMLDTMRGWLPPDERRAAQCSGSHVFALLFPFMLTERVDQAQGDRLEPWADRLLFLSTLSSDADAARVQIARLVAWILDARIADLLDADKAPTPERPGVHAAWIADLVEQWGRALTGARPMYASDTPVDAAARDLCERVIGAVAKATSTRQQALILRHWQRTQQDLLAQASATDDRARRTRLLRRRAKLAEISERFLALIGAVAS